MTALEIPPFFLPFLFRHSQCRWQEMLESTSVFSFAMHMQFQNEIGPLFKFKEFICICHAFKTAGQTGAEGGWRSGRETRVELVPAIPCNELEDHNGSRRTRKAGHREKPASGKRISGSERGFLIIQELSVKGH